MLFFCAHIVVAIKEMFEHIIYNRNFCRT